jgi:hypothetical protein
VSGDSIRAEAAWAAVARTARDVQREAIAEGAEAVLRANTSSQDPVALTTELVDAGLAQARILTDTELARRGLAAAIRSAHTSGLTDDEIAEAVHAGAPALSPEQTLSRIHRIIHPDNDV